MIKLSIIVPVYNAEAFLERAINSISSYKGNDIEFILINDGSTDNSKSICDRFANQDSRIKVFHIENRGVSHARNFGMKKSEGEYIQFIDSDDFLTENAVEEILDAIKKYNSDLVNFGYIKYYKNELKRSEIKYNELIVNDYNKFLAVCGYGYKNLLLHSPCFKVYKKDILVRNNIEFNENFDFGEDLLFNIEYLKVIDNVSIIPKALYNYNLEQGDNSLTNKYREDRFEKFYLLVRKLVDFLKSREFDTKENLENIYSTFYISSLYCTQHIAFAENINYEKKTNLINEVVNNELVRSLALEFKNGSKQNTILTKLLLKKNVKGILSYFKFKSLVSNKLKRLVQKYK